MRRLAISRKQASPERLLSLWTGSFWSFRKQWDSMFRKIWWRQIFSILAGLSPESGTSMQRDIAQGRQSEISELVYAVEDMAAANGVEMPVYHRVIEELKARGL